MKNKKQITLHKIGSKAVFSFVSNANVANDVKQKIDPKTIGKQIYIPFGSDNNHPAGIRENYIKKYTVLAASIKYKTSLIVGQGVYAAKITGYKDNGAEILEPVINTDIINFLNNRNFNSYLKKSAYNLTAFGNLFPELILSENGNDIVRISEKSAVNSRWGVDKNNKIINILLMPNWAEAEEKDLLSISTLNFNEPLLDLQERKNTLKSASYINSMYDFVYYNIPEYETAINSKWADLALKTPQFLNAAYDNAFNALYHVKIPKEYIDITFPESNYEDEEERIKKIDEFLDDIENKMTTAENARKTVLNIGVQDSEGKNSFWELEYIKDASSFTKEIIANDAADNQLTNTFLINDSVFMKKTSSGMGGGSGSDIREAHLINVSMLKSERDAIMEPIELIRDFNNWGDDVVFRFRDSILTTLDTNSGTEKVVS